MEFRDSETKTNLMRAFAGESQARNRYTIAAGLKQYFVSQQTRKRNMRRFSTSICGNLPERT